MTPSEVVVDAWLATMNGEGRIHPSLMQKAQAAKGHMGRLMIWDPEEFR